jgi:hypothetical protein
MELAGCPSKMTMMGLPTVVLTNWMKYGDSELHKILVDNLYAMVNILYSEFVRFLTDLIGQAPCQYSFQVWIFLSPRS